MVEYTSDMNNRVQLILREFKVSQKTLVSFCLQVPPLQANGESIFKNSRLMLDEIIDSEDQDWANLDLLPDTNSESSNQQN